MNKPAEEKNADSNSNVKVDDVEEAKAKTRRKEKDETRWARRVRGGEHAKDG
ncbi:hypothetical protein M569_16575 [Genlisea aurea]|uniref:Uncharacterized protein n=1 Tax=Genlisea aurea TaxID=192259 RepID=S8BUG4_9LAMI|nr:hypothetical protein M569_16575 [Genlisea aurea]